MTTTIAPVKKQKTGGSFSDYKKEISNHREVIKLIKSLSKHHNDTVGETVHSLLKKTLIAVPL